MRPIVLHELADCTSTQDDVRLLATDELALTVLVAARQEHGRGREGRVWEAPPGRALLCSMHLADPCPVERLAALPMEAGRLVVEALAVEFGPRVRRRVEPRAPNDLYVGPRKVGGVLVDARTRGRCVDELVLGVGVNLTGEPFDVDGRQATTIAAALGAVPEVGAEARIARTLAQGLLVWLS